MKRTVVGEDPRSRNLYKLTNIDDYSPFLLDRGSHFISPLMTGGELSRLK
jgi:hypothetical protein